MHPTPERGLRGEIAYLRYEFVGEQLFALERSDALVHNVREQLLAAIPA